MLNVEKNKNYILNITGMNHDGQGVGRIEELVTFVDGAILGEKVEVKIVKVTKAYAIGKLLKLIEPAAGRTEPFCPAFNKCGGCSLQHMDYKSQLKYKTEQVKDAVKRIGKLSDVKINDTLGMDSPLNYRNKAQFPVGTPNGNIAIGFYAGRSHDIIDTENCGIQDKMSDIVRATVREFMKQNDISAYVELSNKGLIRHIVTRVGFSSGEVMVVIVINGSRIPHHDKLIKMLVEKVRGLKSIMLNINTEKTNVILGNKNVCIYGRDSIIDKIGKYSFRISPLSFYQVNPIQTELLYSKVMEYAGLTGEETVFDLYCGIGTITLFLAEKAKKVYGIEVVEEAIADAKKNADLNNIENTEFISGDVEKVIAQMYASGTHADVVVVDPPRKGCDEAVLKTIVGMQPEKVVYVSCNPSTLARDLAYLAENGYGAVEIQPFDMFPWTVHVETITSIERK